MHTIFDVAHKILQKRGSMPALKLQCLLYYTQAWSLVWDGEPLFPEDFEAWAGGPVYPGLYEYLGKYTEEVDASMLPVNKFSKEVFTFDQEDTIDAILRDYGDKDADWLGELTHLEDPWRIARGEHAPGEYCHNIVTKESMASFYDKISTQEVVCR